MDNRSKILHYALNLFAARGYDAIGVQEIVTLAGVTKPTLYHYFGNKRGLLEALVHERCRPLLTELGEASTYAGDLPLSLRRVVSTYFTFAQAEPIMYRMHLAMWFALPDNDAFKVVAAITTEQQRLLEELFIAASSDHGNMRGRHRAYAATLLGMINTYIGLALNNSLTLDDAIVQQVVHQFSHGIYS